MEIVFEFFLEIYLELMMFVVPEEKAASRKYRCIAILVALLCMAGIFALFIWGACLFFDDHRKIGLLPMATAVLLSLAQIVAGFIVQSKK